MSWRHAMRSSPLAAALLVLVVLPAYAQQRKSPEEVVFVQSLGVDLEAMERRPSGLYVQTIEPGYGRLAVPGDRLVMHYTLWLPSGTKIDSSYDRGEPLRLTLGGRGLIEGWTEGATHMTVGEKRRIVVPYELGYGKKGSRPDIPPYATLVFELELIENDSS